MCGVLIEIENGTVLVGVGCNVDRAPAIESTGIDGGREAVSLREVWKDRNAASPDSFDSRQECFSLSQDIFQSFSAWIEGGVGGGLGAETGEDVIEVFQAWMDMSPQILRREYSSRHSSPGGAGAGAGVMDGVESKTSKGDEVEPLGIESDGTLRVATISFIVHKCVLFETFHSGEGSKNWNNKELGCRLFVVNLCKIYFIFNYIDFIH